MDAEIIEVIGPGRRERTLDLQTTDIGIDTPGVSALYNAVDDLHRRLATLLKREI